MTTVFIGTYIISTKKSFIFLLTSLTHLLLVSLLGSNPHCFCEKVFFLRQLGEPLREADTTGESCDQSESEKKYVNISGHVLTKSNILFAICRFYLTFLPTPTLVLTLFCMRKCRKHSGLDSPRYSFSLEGQQVFN